MGYLASGSEMLEKVAKQYTFIWIRALRRLLKLTSAELAIYALAQNTFVLNSGRALRLIKRIQQRFTMGALIIPAWFMGSLVALSQSEQ
ncbi:MAG: hypothetical protein ACI88A_004802 [Paraglaciecola sp.]|jgi:hypothetical protein